ncbi:hypothetical protein MUK42_14492 [Musa troglodytarum]|uniref:Uncharacterized protein n=1 Tax=Musa troglodytarum TaxID=320322 RepID=A0A9E7I805_9LILI|nr:hypothetical protein MUK42_14492 [Musa troglodytarum]
MQMYSNALRKLHYPWEHVLGMGLGLSSSTSS